MVKKRTMGSLYFNDASVDVGSVYNGEELTIGNTVLGKEIAWVEVNGLGRRRPVCLREHQCRAAGCFGLYQREDHQH